MVYIWSLGKAFRPWRCEAYLAYPLRELRLGHQEQKLLPGRNGELKLAHRTTFGETSLKLGARTKNCIEVPSEAGRADVVVATHGGLPGGEVRGAKGVPDGLRH